MEDEHKRSGMMTRDEWMAWLRESWAEAQARTHTIKTWRERCEEHPDHEGIVTERMIHSRMQEEIDELRQAIEQAETREWVGLNHLEPVAWANSFDLQNFDMKVRTGPDLHHTVPLYTAPPKQWVSLTDEEISAVDWKPNETLHDYARHIELKLRGKNT